MQKLEYFFVVSRSERSYTFRVSLNALRTYTLDTLVQDTLTNYNLSRITLLSIDLILFCRQQVYCADGHSMGGAKPPTLPLGTPLPANNDNAAEKWCDQYEFYI